MIRTKELYLEIQNILKNGGIEEFKAEAKLILKFASKISLEDILKNEIIADNLAENAKNCAIKRVSTSFPVQYILGYANFMEKTFKINENVLIPRDETELLVLKTLEKIKKIKSNKVKILDIGTGSGIIPISIALRADNVEILGVDISTSALTLAIENGQKYLPSNIVLFRKSDLFSNIKEKFDIIVSNPPYIPKNEKINLQKEVTFEPHEALFAPDEKGIYYYEKIISNAKEHLNNDGYIIFEMGINQWKPVKELLEKAEFSEIEIFKDMAEIERIIVAKC